jgi:antitoxin ParD1/3/4
MPEVQKVSVALTNEQLISLKAAVDTGEYATTSEIVREAIRDWQFKREMRKEDLKRLRDAWDTGIASGPASPLDFAQHRKKARQLLKQASRNPHK